MTQEQKAEKDKKLLLKDLCMRLPYGVKIKFNDGTNNAYNLDGNINGKFTENVLLAIDDLELKPYLRSMTSMTKEEREYVEELSNFKATPDIVQAKIDFYMEHFINYRLPDNLFIEAPKGMYNIKN